LLNTSRPKEPRSNKDMLLARCPGSVAEVAFALPIKTNDLFLVMH
jgi:hypothetical protein